MSKPGSDKPLSSQKRPEEPPIRAVCLIPEFPPLIGGQHEEAERLDKHTREQYVRFAQRFEHAFHITTRHGLKQVGYAFGPSPKNYGDMRPEERHVFLLHLDKQMSAFNTRGVPFIVIAGGLLTQGMRRLDYKLVMPLASMSPPMRRRWLVARNAETNMQIWEAIFAVAPFSPGWTSQANGSDGRV